MRLFRLVCDTPSLIASSETASQIIRLLVPHLAGCWLVLLLRNHNSVTNKTQYLLQFGHPCIYNDSLAYLLCWCGRALRPPTPSPLSLLQHHRRMPYLGRASDCFISGWTIPALSTSSRSIMQRLWSSWKKFRETVFIDFGCIQADGIDIQTKVASNHKTHAALSRSGGPMKQISSTVRFPAWPVPAFCFWAQKAFNISKNLGFRIWSESQIWKQTCRLWGAQRPTEHILQLQATINCDSIALAFEICFLHFFQQHNQYSLFPSKQGCSLSVYKPNVAGTRTRIAIEANYMASIMEDMELTLPRGVANKVESTLLSLALLEQSLVFFKPQLLLSRVFVIAFSIRVIFFLRRGKFRLVAAMDFRHFFNSSFSDAHLIRASWSEILCVISMDAAKSKINFCKLS